MLNYTSYVPKTEDLCKVIVYGPIDEMKKMFSFVRQYGDYGIYTREYTGKLAVHFGIFYMDKLEEYNITWCDRSESFPHIRQIRENNVTQDHWNLMSIVPEIDAEIDSLMECLP